MPCLFPPCGPQRVCVVCACVDRQLPAVDSLTGGYLRLIQRPAVACGWSVDRQSPAVDSLTSGYLRLIQRPAVACGWSVGRQLPAVTPVGRQVPAVDLPGPSDNPLTFNVLLCGMSRGRRALAGTSRASPSLRTAVVPVPMPCLRGPLPALQGFAVGQEDTPPPTHPIPPGPPLHFPHQMWR